ncbi:MFS transporter [Streptomyces sp. NPDC057638]|uniref:MFS transporter n=1 Tax=Streptomyces sp. NPDC057638 TaxID=3346190 RepID=UPI0036A3A856
MKPPWITRRALTLGTLLLSYLVFPMQMTGTALALPTIGQDLDASGPALQWVVTGYVLAASSVMLVAGSLGDLLGRRRVFSFSLALYAAGTLAGAASQSILVLDVARTVTGVGGAGLMTGGVAILATMFEGPARARVFAAVGSVAGIGIAAGPTLSGWLIGGFGWRAAFVFFGVAALVILAATRLIPESRAPERPTVDRPGVITFIAGQALVMFAITRGADAGWASPAVLGPLLAGAALLVLFVRVERRSPHPVLRLELFQNRTFRGWLVGAVFLSTGATGVLVFLPAYLQGTGGLTTGDAGLVMLLATVPVFVLPSVGTWLAGRGLAPRLLLVGALTLSALGNLTLALALGPDAGVARLAVPLILIGIGNGLALGQVETQALGAVDPARVGMASGLLSTARGGAGALVLAGFGAALLSLVESGLGDPALAGRVATGQLAERAGEFTDAWRTVLLAVALLLALAVALVARLLRARPSRRDAITPVSVPVPVPGSGEPTAAGARER